MPSVLLCPCDFNLTGGNKMNYCMQTIRDSEAEHKIKALQQYLKDNNIMLVHKESNIAITFRDNFNKTLATAYTI